MGKSLVFTPGCKYTFVKEGCHEGCHNVSGHALMFVEYETVSGEHKRQRFDLADPSVYFVIDGHRQAPLSYISNPPEGVKLDIKRVCYREESCWTIIGGKMFIPTRIEFDTVIPTKRNDKAEETHNKLLLRNVTNSKYGIASRDWGDVLADSAMYAHMQKPRCSGKTLWLSSATSFDKDPLRELREEYLKAIGREEDEKLGRWLRVPEFISDDLEDCEKGVPNTKLIDPTRLYFQDTTTGEMKPYEGVKNITPMAMTREEMQYCLNDVAVTEKLFKEEQIMRFDSCKPTIKNVIFNDPATIVMWSDGTKTVVKCGEGDTFDPEKGVAMCCMKKLLGTNKTGSNYLDKVQEYFDAYDEDCIEECKTIGEILKEIWGDAFGPTQLPTPDVNTGAMDIPPEDTVEKEFEAVTSSDWTLVPADENQVAEENGE